ncbi:MAG: ACT domain-containing protein [Ilumatobacteraceae bacterium]
MHTIVVRVWLPDRPGALGQVASRIGAVRGDVLGIEVLESGAGNVIDELVVRLPDEQVVALMVSEVDAVDGVSVEHVRSLDGGHIDPDMAALTLVAEVAELPPEQRIGALVRGLHVLTGATWSAALDGVDAVATSGPVPDLAFIRALRDGSGHLGDAAPMSSELFWEEVAGVALVAGRDDRPIHTRERSRVALVARIAGSLLAAPGS